MTTHIHNNSVSQHKSWRWAVLAGTAVVSLSLMGSVQTAYNVTGVSASPNPFHQGGSTTISYNLGQGALLWVNVLDASGAVRRTLAAPASSIAANRTAGSNRETWDGRDNGGALLPAGKYNYTINDVFFSAHLAGAGGNPHDIAPVPTTPNTLWATGKTSPYVFKSTTGGSTWTRVAGTGANAKAYGVVVSNDGQRVFIANDGVAGLVYSSNGGSTWTRTAAFPGGSTTVNDVAVNSTGTIVYAVDYQQRKIYRSANSGGAWTTCAAAGLSGLSTSLYGVATDASGTVVMLPDGMNNRVYKSNDNCASFTPVSTITTGTAPGQVSFPYQIVIENDGKFWLSERDNHRVQQFDSSGRVLMTVGGPAVGTGNFEFNSGAKYFGIGLAVASGQPYLYVADYNNMRVKKLGFDNWISGTPLEITTSTGGGSGGSTAQTSAGVAVATAFGGRSISISMPYSADQDGDNSYKVEYKPASDSAWTTWVANAMHVAGPYETTINGLTARATYDVRMTYVDPDGVTGTNPQTVRVTLPTCNDLRAPNGLTAVDTPNDDGESISLTWTPSTSTCVVEQRIFRSANGGSSFVLLEIIPGNTISSYIDYSVDRDIQYAYRVRAFDGGVLSGDTNNASAVAVDDLPPVAQTGLMATAGDGKVFLSWAQSISWDVREQRVYRRELGSGSYQHVNIPIIINGVSEPALTGADNEYVDTTAANGKTYEYVLRAWDGTHESVNSNVASANPASSRLDPPTGLAGAASDSRVQLRWRLSGSAGITQQRIYRRTAGGSYAQVGAVSGTSTSYVDTTTVNGTIYYYVVRAFNGTVESGNSNELTIAPVANIPPTAFNGTLSVLTDGRADGKLSANDPNGDALTFAIVANGTKGTAMMTNSSAGTYRYVPKPGHTGADTFTFRVTDGQAMSNTGTITVTIGGTAANTTLNAGMNLVSIPTSLAPVNDFNSVLSDDVGGPPEVFMWPNAQSPGTFDGQFQVAVTAAPGHGYWLRILNNATVIDDQHNGENTTQCDAASFPGVRCVDVVLNPGGNIIGNPYPVVRDLLQASQVKVCNATKSLGCKLASDWKPFAAAVTSGWVLNTIYNYNPQTNTYEYVQSVADGAMKIAPWEGWWLRVETKDQMKLRFYR